MSSSKIRYVLVSSLLLFTPLSYTAYADGATSRSDLDDPVISLSFPFTEQSVDVRPGSSGQVNFTFWVYCLLPADTPEDEDLEVHISACAWWWNVTKVPTLYFNKAIIGRDARITVTAPVNSSADTVVDLELWGTWRYRNSDEEGVLEKVKAARITVQPFYDLYIGSNHPKQYADVGDRVEYLFNVTNRSNMDVNISFEIEDDSDHLSIMFDNRTTRLLKGETRTLSFSVRQEPSISRGNTIHVKAVIEEDPEHTEWDLPLMFYTEPKFSTFFYERNFIRLIVIIAIISAVSVGMFLFEHLGRDKDTSEEIKDDKISERAPRRLEFPGKR
ncbi:MAG: hypothetical protein JW939_08660 [Candidatus Thermoplasmatota archaeon]|nr:hypothetical protein [Candidatus Thermoplasmatota archaeon]